MAGPITKEYMSATSKSFISNNNNGKMIEKNFIETEGTFLLKICDNAFHENDGEDVFKHINSFLEVVEPLKIRGLIEKFVLKFYNLCEHAEERKTVDDNDLDTKDFGRGPCANMKTNWTHDLYLGTNQIFGASNVGCTRENQGYDEHMGNETPEQSVCKIRRFEMMKYSFSDNEEYITIKESDHLNHLKKGLDAYPLAKVRIARTSSNLFLQTLLEVVEKLLESIKDEEVSLVDGVLEGALGALGFGNGCLVEYAMDVDSGGLSFKESFIGLLRSGEHLGSLVLKKDQESFGSVGDGVLVQEVSTSSSSSWPRGFAFIQFVASADVAEAKYHRTSYHITRLIFCDDRYGSLSQQSRSVETEGESSSVDEELREFTSEYYIPFALHPVVPAASASIADFPVGKVGVYTRFFEFANQRVPLSLFMCNVLNHYRLHISQLHCIGAAKITNFEVNCRLLAIHPTVHLFRAFYHTSWSNGWVSFSKRAGRLQCYTEKLDALRRWREMFFWVDDALVPWDFAFYTPGSYSMEDAELINENRIPINAYSEAFLCHMGISRNYFQSPEEVPTFIGDDGRGGCLSFLLPQMDLFSVVHLSKPKLVTEGVRPLRDGEEPLLESTAGRTMELVLEQPEVESTDVLAPTPLRSVPSATVEPPRPDATSVGSAEDTDVAEVDSGLKRRRTTGDDGAGPSKRVRHPSLGLSTSTEEETPDASPTLAAKEVTEIPPPNVEATSDSSAPVTHAAQSPPQTGPKAFEGMPVDQLMEEFDMVTAQQVALVSQLRARFSNERSQSIQKDEEILLLKTQLADAQAEAESSRSYAQNLAEEKMALLVKNNHFAGLDEFRQRVEGLLEKQEEKLRKLSIEYDEELYPHMLSAIAERRWLISHGLRLAAMSTLESQEVKQSFGDVVKCALARGKAEAVEELHEKRLLTVPAAQVPGYNDQAYEELVAAMEAMKLLELPHIAQLERDQDYPIDVIMAGLTLARHASEGAEGQPDYFLKPDVAQLQVPIFSRPRDILNPFALEREIPLKESLEAHAIRLAKKKGVKGKAILCGVGAAHIPRSDGVPVSVATVLPKDSELLGKLEEAGDAAYQVGRSEQSRCHSV
ncbi:hypothetical protein Tco_0407072 [Tanacetum coccineum]